MPANKTPTDNVKHSEPIPIANSATRRARDRSASLSSGSSGSDSSISEVPPTPSSPSAGLPSPGSSPILSYFLAQSPTGKTPLSGKGPLSTFPFRKFGPSAVVEEEDESKEIPVAAHARRASMNAGRFAQPPSASALPDGHQERGQSLMRRLSLSSNAFVKPPTDGRARSPPNVPPNTAVSPTSASLPFSRDNKPRRAATISGPENGKPRRAPSPMGERILKGHFDGFN